MADQVIQCPECGVKLKLKDDRQLPQEAPCPKCGAALFKKKSVAPTRFAKPVRKPIQEEYDEFDEDEFENEAPRKKSRKRSRQSSGMPVGLIAGLGGALVVGLLLVGYLLFKPAQNPNAAAPAAPAAPSTPATSGAVTPTAVAPAAPPATAAAGAPAPAATNPNAAPATLPNQPAAAANGVLAKYSPQVDSSHAYQIDITAEFDKYSERSSGSCTLTTQNQVNQGFSVRVEPQSGSGTGVVVGSNGVIVTCAHVVDGAKDIQITLGAQTFTGTVLHSDAAKDLAVVKIEAQGLTTVPLGNSDQLQLGHTLRVIGFPLSDVLGQGIKATQGTVSGLIEKDGQRLINTDATINPGNSGGPVFNTRGEVVGIASAKLAGVTISQVGFCVPSNTLSAWLQQQVITLTPQSGAQEMEAPALIQKVTPAVAFIQVTSGPPMKADIGFNYSANISTRREPKGGRLMLPGISPPTMESGTISLSSNGEPVELSDGSFAPIVMSRLPLLPFVELPRSRQTEWTNQKEISIVREARARSRFGFRNPLMDDLFPEQRPQVVSVQKALEKDQFRVESDDNQQLVLTRTYDLQTTDGSQPGMHLSGTGKWVFDRTTGMPVSSGLQGTYQVTVSGVTITIPYTCNVKRLTQADLDKVRDLLAKAQQNNGGEMPAGARRIPGNALGREAGAKPIARIEEESWGFKTLNASPDGKFLAVSTNDEVRIHEFVTGKEVDTKSLKGLGDPKVAAFSPDGKHLLLGGYEGTIRIFAVDPQGNLDSVADYAGHSSEIKAIRILDDNQTVLSSDSKKRVRAWEIQDQKEQYSVAGIEEEIVALGVTSDGQQGLAIDRNSSVSLFNIADGKITNTTKVVKFFFGDHAAFSPDGTILFLGNGQKLEIFRMKSKKPPAEFEAREMVYGICICPATNEVFISTMTKVLIFDYKSEKQVAEIAMGDGSFETRVVCTPDGRYLAAMTSALNKQVLIFDRQNLKPADEKADADAVNADDNGNKPKKP